MNLNEDCLAVFRSRLHMSKAVMNKPGTIWRNETISQKIKFETLLFQCTLNSPNMEWNIGTSSAETDREFA